VTPRRTERSRRPMLRIAKTLAKAFRRSGQRALDASSLKSYQGKLLQVRNPCQNLAHRKSSKNRPIGPTSFRF